MYPLHVVPSSENSKVGPCATTYRPVGDSAKGEGTCPSCCPHLNAGCYTYKGKTRLWATRSANTFNSMSKVTSKAMRFIRFLTAGDWMKHDPGSDTGYSVDLEHANDAVMVCRVNPWATAWSYCHDIKQWVKDTGLFPAAGNMPKNFHLLASCEDQAMKDFAIAHGFKTARVITSESERAEDEIFCPYDRALHHGKTNREIKVRCVTCQLCWKAPEGKNIAFLKH